MSEESKRVLMLKRLQMLTKTLTGPLPTPQVAQARNMSVGEHRQCCATFEI